MWSPEVTTEVTEQHNTTLSLPALWCLVQLKICQVSLLVSGTELFIFRSGVFLQQFLRRPGDFSGVLVATKTVYCHVQPEHLQLWLW